MPTRIPNHPFLLCVRICVCDPWSSFSSSAVTTGTSSIYKIKAMNVSTPVLNYVQLIRMRVNKGKLRNTLLAGEQVFHASNRFEVRTILTFSRILAKGKRQGILIQAVRQAYGLSKLSLWWNVATIEYFQILVPAACPTIPLIIFISRSITRSCCHPVNRYLSCRSVSTFSVVDPRFGTSVIFRNSQRNLLWRKQQPRKWRTGFLDFSMKLFIETDWMLAN